SLPFLSVFSPSSLFAFFLSCPPAPRLLPSFPTRRSSDLLRDVEARHDLHAGGERGLQALGRRHDLVEHAVHPEADAEHLLVGLRSEEHTSELQSLTNLVCRLLLEKKKHTIPSSETNRSLH